MGTITFWVCILVSPTRETTVKLTSDMRHLLGSIPADMRLCYFRIFNDMQEALGHKLLIEKCSMSYWKMIKREKVWFSIAQLEKIEQE